MRPIDVTGEQRVLTHFDLMDVLKIIIDHIFIYHQLKQKIGKPNNWTCLIFMKINVFTWNDFEIS